MRLALLTAVFFSTSAALAQSETRGVIPAIPIEQPGQPAAKPKPAVRKPVYDEHADARQQIAAALASAKKNNRRVLIQWGGNWCPWCIRLHELYSTDKKIAHELLYEYDLVCIDAGRPDNKNLDLASSYGADLKKHGFPFLTILDADGKPIANQETEALEVKNDKGESSGVEAGHNQSAVLKFLVDHQPDHPAATGVLNDALSRAKTDHKLVFLHFGAPWCGWCHRLEDWMASTQPAAILDKHFIDCKIDVDRTQGGDEMQVRFTGGKQTGIPVFFFLDADGKVLAGSIAADGNIGFPAQPAEIAHFGTMLKAAGINLSQDEIAALLATLKPSEAQAPAH